MEAIATAMIAVAAAACPGESEGWRQRPGLGPRPEASPEACAIGRVCRAAHACCQYFQSTPIACDCPRPEQYEESVLKVDRQRQPPITWQIQIGDRIGKKRKGAHHGSYDKDSWSAAQQPNAEHPSRRTRPVEVLCVLGQEEERRGRESSRALQ